MLTNRLNSFGINDDSEHRGFRFPTLFPFVLKNHLFNYCQKSDRHITMSKALPSLFKQNAENEG
jgi:hypothetical protein